jgi:hypothetical protein
MPAEIETITKAKPEVPLPDDWRPSEGDKAYGISLNLTEARSRERRNAFATVPDRKTEGYPIGAMGFVIGS